MAQLSRWGIELEGGWDRWPPLQNRLKSDGSVSARGSHHVGEWTSPILDYPLPDMRGYLEPNWPHHINDSCGMHVHVSFGQENHRVIGAIAGRAPTFEASLLEFLRQAGKRLRVTRQTYWDRLEGKNRYCLLGADPCALIGHRERYRTVNFDSWHAHRTIEIRVLPMLSASLGVLVVDNLLAWIDCYVRVLTDQDLSCELESSISPEEIPLPTVKPTTILELI